LPQSAPLIEQHIRALGFRVEDVRLIVNSHSHFDHAGGIATLRQDSGATVAASAWGARVLQQGRPLPDDPQFGVARPGLHFEPIAEVKVVADGERLHVGALEITAVATAGHTPGSVSWTWKFCDKNRCLDVVYADSLNPVSADGYRFTGDGASPDISDVFLKSIAKVAALPCDIIVSVHPEFTGILDKQGRLLADESANPFVDKSSCRAYADNAAKLLRKRVDSEHAGVR
jgi:metallo-beta-lactamase class B